MRKIREADQDRSQGSEGVGRGEIARLRPEIGKSGKNAISWILSLTPGDGRCHLK